MSLTLQQGFLGILEQHNLPDLAFQGFILKPTHAPDSLLMQI